MSTSAQQQQGHTPPSPSASPLPLLFIGIDVGSESVRAGLFTGQGDLLANARHPIDIWTEMGGIAEQSCEQIWTGICETVRQITGKIEDVRMVRGIGFCATCSMVVVDGQGNSLPITPNHIETAENDPTRDVLMWMDHRATEQANRLNVGNAHRHILQFSGGQISPEMEVPKLIWLKEHKREECFEKAAHFFDLADWCTWKATGSAERSICTLTCKWTYLAHEKRFDANFFRSIGLEELAEENFGRIGQKVLEIGEPIAGGLSEGAAIEMGVTKGTPVATGLVDAHAGALGTLCNWMIGDEGGGVEHQMAFILGTSACTINLTKQPILTKGIWGPYYGVVWPNYWLNEGGITAFGSALLFALRLHPYFSEFKRKWDNFDDSKLIKKLEELAINNAGGCLLASSTAFGQNVHICPEFLGNRSPHADPHSSGIISGIRMDNGRWESAAGLAEWMVIVLTGLCCGIREIIESLEEKLGSNMLEEIVVSGGMAKKSPLLLRLLCDMTQKRIVVVPEEGDEPVLLGAALNGAVAAGRFNSIEAASREMVARRRAKAQLIEPQRSEEVRQFHEKKYNGYRRLKRCERELRELQI